MTYVFGTNNPGIGGLKELTSAETSFIQNLSGLSYAQGDIIYHNGTNLTRLPAGTSGQFLKTLGAGANPLWADATSTVPTAITVANEATDTTCFLGFFTDATGDLGPKTNANMTFNSNTGVVTFASSILTTTDINGGTIDGTVIGGSSAVAGTFTTAVANSFVPNSSTIPTNGMYLPAANTLGWAVNSAAELQLTATALSPVTDDGLALGTTALGWQSLFGDTGFVINIENGDWVATHTAGILTVGTGDLRVTTAGTNAASVVTVGGTQTLTAKTLTSPTITTSPTAAGATWTNLGTVTTADINGGTIDGTVIGGASAAAGTFTTLIVNTGPAIVGHTASLSTGGITANYQQFGATAGPGAQVLGMFNATAGTQAEFQFYRSKNASIGSATVVASGDGLGKITWYGAQQTGTFATQSTAAQIRAEVDGVVTSGAGGDMPGRIIFSTTPDASGTLTDRLILDAAGILKPNANDGVALGTGTLAYADLFLASGGVINWNNGNATLTHSAGLLTSNVAMSLGTSLALTTGTIELGHATDTTLSRSAAGVLAVEGVAVPTISSTSTVTNKRNQPRIVSAASYTTDTGTSLDVSTTDIFVITAQAGALLFNSPGGTPVQGEKLIIRIKDNGTARALTWNAVFRAMGTALPSTTVLSKTLYLGFIYNSTDTKWDLIASAQEA